MAVTIEMTAERLRAMDDNGMSLYATPGAQEPYWNHTASFMHDQCIATVTDFLDEVGYDDLEGVEDDEIFSLDVEMLPALSEVR